MIDEDVADERRRTWVLVGIGGAIVSVLLGLFGPHDAAIPRAPRVLQARVETALLNAGFPGVEARFDGQRAKLRGFVEAQQDVAAVTRVALTAAGAGGPWAGGVTGVDASALAVGAAERPFTWSARRMQGDGVTLSGAAPSDAARTELLAVARDAFPLGEPQDDMHAAAGAASPQFTAVARVALRKLVRLNYGEARIVDDQVIIIGDGDQGAVDEVRRAFAHPPAPFHARLDLTIDGADAEHPELQGLNLASGDAEVCTQAFSRLMAKNVINFETGSAAIDPSSREILNALASVARRCDRFSIEVAGHTDNVGAREINMDLSQRRADAVAAVLASQGVARTRLTARGYGPDRPRASNMGEAGRAANRRIEFNVTG